KTLNSVETISANSFCYGAQQASMLFCGSIASNGERPATAVFSQMSSHWSNNTLSITKYITGY
ncbi:MAG: hypothetical protein Q4A54_10625, partial [Parabacteroides sp.]|nr:hypothetical protein [Parabacteroides sp.]